MITKDYVPVITATCDICSETKVFNDIPDHPLAYLYLEKKVLGDWLLSEKLVLCGFCADR